MKALLLSTLIFCAAATQIGCASSQNARDNQKVIKTAAGNVVEVGIYDGKIHIPTVIPKGHEIFRISNPTRVDHGFKIVGNGVEAELPQALQEGGTADLGVDLQPGAYQVYCTMVGHKDLGERLWLNVNP